MPTTTTQERLRIAKFSVHIFISVSVLIFAMGMMIWDPAGIEQRPVWSGLIGTIVGVWIKKWKLKTDPETGPILPVTNN